MVYEVLPCNSFLVICQVEPNLFLLTLLYPMLLKLNIEFHRGSFLDLFFLIYMIMIYSPHHLFLKFILFADDTNLFASHTNLDTLVELTQIELDKVSTWLKLINCL